MTTQVGERVAHYRIMHQLGEGGMGVVLLARDEALGRNVALKLLSPRYADNVQFRARFTRESRLAAAIDHPNIIPIFEAGEAQEQLFIAMRYVDGPDLRRVLAEQGPLAPARAVATVEQVARALDAAHHAGLVHRDVKPGNVMIDPSEGRDHCYLTDFGLTKNMSSSSGYTETGQFVGTLHYMAPEQIDDRKVDGRADQYALACVLFECLAGFPPFRRDSDVALMYAHLNEPPPALCALRPELPPGVDTILARALAKAASDRYASCCAMLGEFRAALAGASVPAFRPSIASTRRRFARPEPAAEPVPPAPQPAPSTGRATRGDVPAREARQAPPAYVSQAPMYASPPPPTAKLEPAAAEQKTYLRAALIVAVAILLCAGSVTAALVLKSDNGGSGLSASERTHSELVNRTVRLHREIVTVSRKVEKARGKTGAATKARLEKDLREAKAIAKQARAEQTAAVAGARSLTAATAKLTGVVTELIKVADGQTREITKLREQLDDAQAAVEDASSDPAMPEPIPDVTPPVVGAGARAAVVKLPNDATTTVTAPARKQISSVIDVGDVDGDGRSDFGFVTSAADGAEPTAFVVLRGTGDRLALGSLGADEGFEVKGATGIASAGDVNGDEHDDLVATGPPSADPGLPSSAFVVHGGGSLGDLDLSTDAVDLQIDLPVPNAAADAAPLVRSAGDFDGDGFGDLVVGDPAANSGSGGAWVVRGSDGSDASTPLALDALAPSDGFAITGDEGDGFGSAVSSADVNGDGYSDVVVGAPHAGGDADDAGAAFVVYGADPVPDAVDVSELGDGGFAIRGSDAGSLAGTVVARVGDLSGDDNDDLLVTAPGSSPHGRSGAGSAFVIFGPGDASPDIALDSLDSGGFEIQGPAAMHGSTDLASTGFGSLAASARDLDADDTPDLVIGAAPAAGEGALAYLVYGKADSDAVDLASQSGAALPILSAGATGLQSLAGGADLDGDGQPDVVLGPSEPSGGSATAYATSGAER
jgi:hypothetical protein